MFENSPSTTTRMLSPLRCGLGDASGDATAQALTITNVQARVALRSRDIDIDITLVGTAGVDRDRVGSCHRQRLRRQIELAAADTVVVMIVPSGRSSLTVKWRSVV